MTVPKGLPVVLSAPSGAGKSTIAARVMEENKNIVASISCTTRSPRPNEKNGVHYHFVSDLEFKKRIKEGDFLEWAEVHGNYYGTPRSALEEQLAKGNDVILTIDVQGALSAKRFFPNGIYIFLVPPSWDALERRLTKRASDDSKAVEIRQANARKELSYLSHYDYLVINDDLESAVRDVSAILRAEHCRLSRIDKRTVPILA
jgi:guanylate kinase